VEAMLRSVSGAVASSFFSGMDPDGGRGSSGGRTSGGNPTWGGSTSGVAQMRRGSTEGWPSSSLPMRPCLELRLGEEDSKGHPSSPVWWPCGTQVGMNSRMCENEARNGEGMPWVWIYVLGFSCVPLVSGCVSHRYPFFLYFLENRKSPDMYLGASGGIPVSRLI
jgi:hypothetical protein